MDYKMIGQAHELHTALLVDCLLQIIKGCNKVLFIMHSPVASLISVVIEYSKSFIHW